MKNTIEDDSIKRLIIQIRNNWGTPDYDFDRCIRSLGMALFRCSDDMTPTIQAMIEEASTRQLYQVMKTIR